ncbi:MAG: cation diffusion facilitator family transporter [Candidatus Aminicenantes bacterium]|nr:cation diffusion facilitator family transporter [Candidatus Aminicenantes bacterium]
MSHREDSLAIGDGALDRKLWVTATLNVAITITEFAGGLFAGSMALLSDAAHNLSDVVAVLMALVARRFSRRLPTVRHTFGLKRVEVVAALANAVLLVGVTVLIARAAVVRLLHPEPVSQGIMLVVALVALAANIGSVLLLRGHDKNDVNVRSAFLHMAQDALASLAVVVAAVLAHTPAGPYVDAIAALVVGLVVLRSALSLAWETLSTILEGVPSDVSIVDLADRVERTFPPSRLHHVHVWEIGPNQRLLTAHVAVGREMTCGDIESFLSRLKAFLNEQWAINHATIEPEVAGCGRSELLGRWGDPQPPDQAALPLSAAAGPTNLETKGERS